ncbi:hypothetical protein DFA_02136 [Cavenderia fasciculata]|uniref:TLDc domain-containing protein n=1 Tax=Cavenderia fasciculata TaxID=261658 RepID=F4PYT3_CACFS|nr:uncharacterized protein DFA_02136 [Cavenderia fasciculata]EGG19349.1 hypothetical protein DFA_02136 [Cavenderia fasciculata]|eukprot:XP_004357620.1 hypothetical protein DFA_02136 [Cavenderia fasciculata]
MLDKTQITVNQITELLEEAKESYKNDIKELNEEIEKLTKTRKELLEFQKVVDISMIADPVTLVVGGVKFQASKATLTSIKGTYFDAMLSGDIKITSVTGKPNTFFIDRDGTNFAYILNYLRDHDAVIFPASIKSAIERELQFYKITIPEPPCSMLDHVQMAPVYEWLGSHKKLNLIYKATKDGFEAKSFHDKCDGKGATITFIKSIEGEVFGGYNSQSWNSDNNQDGYGDTNCFIFTIINNYGREPTKFVAIPGFTDGYVYGYSTHGPMFGSDIQICSNSNNDINSYSGFPHHYHESSKISQGRYTFCSFDEIAMEEIEVFTTD